jgi:hypothetical protein
MPDPDPAGVIGAQQSREPDHLQVASAKQVLDVAIARRRYRSDRFSAAVQLRHVGKTPGSEELEQDNVAAGVLVQAWQW